MENGLDQNVLTELTKELGLAEETKDQEEQDVTQDEETEVNDDDHVEDKKDPRFKDPEWAKENQSFKDKYKDLEKKFQELETKLAEASKPKETDPQDNLTPEQKQAVETIKAAGLQDEWTRIEKEYIKYAEENGTEEALEKYGDIADQMLNKANTILKDKKLESRLSVFENEKATKEAAKVFDDAVTKASGEDEQLKKAISYFLKKDWAIDPSKPETVIGKIDAKFVKAAKLEAVEYLKELTKPKENRPRLQEGRSHPIPVKEKSNRRSYADARVEAMKYLNKN